jgi:hypothetical protein
MLRVDSLQCRGEDPWAGETGSTSDAVEDADDDATIADDILVAA